MGTAWQGSPRLHRNGRLCRQPASAREWRVAERAGPGPHFYTLPDLGDGVKVAIHHQGETVQADTVRREVDALEIENVRGLMSQFLPAAAGRLKAASTCI